MKAGDEVRAGSKEENLTMRQRTWLIDESNRKGISPNEIRRTCGIPSDAELQRREGL